STSTSDPPTHNDTGALPPVNTYSIQSQSLPLSLAFAEPVVIPVGAILVSLILFGGFVWLAGANPVTSFQLMYKGAFGSKFSWQNTLIRSAPLMLTGLCTALPLRLGMVIIGGEGAIVMGALAAALVAHLMPAASALVAISAMASFGCLVGAAWIMLPGALKYYR